MHSPTLGHCCERRKWLQYFVVPKDAFSLFVVGAGTDVAFMKELVLFRFATLLLLIIELLFCCWVAKFVVVAVVMVAEVPLVNCD